MSPQKISIVHRIDCALWPYSDSTPQVHRDDGIVWMRIRADSMLPECFYQSPLVLVYWRLGSEPCAWAHAHAKMTRISLRDVFPDLCLLPWERDHLGVAKISLSAKDWHASLPHQLTKRFLCRLDWIRARVFAQKRSL